MYCKNCGKQIEDKAVICVHCGSITDNYVKNTRAVSSYRNEFYAPFLGLIFSFFIPIAGLIISIVQFVRAKRVCGETKYALCGIIISALLVGISVLIFFVTIYKATWAGINGFYF